MLYTCIYGIFFVVAFYLSKRNPNFYPFQVIALSLTVLSLFQWYSENYLDLSDSIRTVEYYASSVIQLTCFGAVMFIAIKAIWKSRQRDGG